MALHADNFKVASLQLVAFTPNATDFEASALLGVVLGTYAKRFDGEIESFPFRGEVPPEFPRIQLASRDGRWAFRASQVNATSAWIRKGDEAASIEEIVASCREPLEQHIRDNGVRVGRLGYVISRTCAEENPARVLVDQFCRDEVKDANSAEAPLRHSLNFEIHNHKRYRLSQPDVQVNSWVRCKTGINKIDDSTVIIVEQDINSLSEDMETRLFTAMEVGQFFDTCKHEANSILEKYFPQQR